MNILVILCAALGQSRTGHTWQGWGRGLQVSCVGGHGPHVPVVNGPKRLRRQWEQAIRDPQGPDPDMFQEELQLLWGGDIGGKR